MSRRAPTAADVRALEADLRRRGFEIYCGPSYYAAGHCRPGKHPHGQFSRHFAAPGMALDFGWPGPPIHDLEALHVELLMEELGRHPTIRWRRLWNLGPGDHQDHGHVDDAYGWRGYIERVTPRPGVRDRDGRDLFVSPRAFPQHVPPTNSGYTLAAIVAFQELAPQLTNPKTGRPFYGGHVDGYLGKATRAAAEAIQAHLGLTRDGLPGPRTMSALRAAIERQDSPPAPPKPDPQARRAQQLLTGLGYDLGPAGADGFWGPASDAAARTYATDYGVTLATPTPIPALLTHLEDTMSNILTELQKLNRRLDNLPSDFWNHRLYGLVAHQHLRRGLITDPTHRNFPADPGSPADKELRREAAETGHATVYTADGMLVLTLDEDGDRFKIEED